MRALHTLCDWLAQQIWGRDWLARRLFRLAFWLNAHGRYPAWACDFKEVSRCAPTSLGAICLSDVYYVQYCAAHTSAAVQDITAYLAEHPDVRVYCPVCDAPDLDEPWPDSHQICGQCGTQFGLDDATTPHAALRAEWITGGRQAWRAKEAA